MTVMIVITVAVIVIMVVCSYTRTHTRESTKRQVHLPEGKHILQFNCHPKETVGDVLSVVRGLLTDEHRGLDLYL
jgi:hypothetical protein